MGVVRTAAYRFFSLLNYALMGCLLSLWQPTLSFCEKKLTSPSGQNRGQVTGLPVPRYASLRTSDPIKVRAGPSRKHRVLWIFQHKGVPVEIIAEFEVWRKIRDYEGAEGWIIHSFMSGRRTCLIAPWKKEEIFLLYAKPDENTRVKAYLHSNVLAQVKQCDKSWCQINVQGIEGYMSQNLLWGVYPDERLP